MRLSTMLIVILVLITPQWARAQPGPNAPGGQADGSQSKTTAGSSGSRLLPHQLDVLNAPVALRGYCPVCLVEMSKWVKGSDQFRVVVDGKSYLFPDRERMAMFQAATEKYVPALGGDCTVHFARTRQRVPGQLRFGLVNKGRLYFFTSDQHRQMFLADAKPYADLDLALGGECVVCRRDMNRSMPGRPDLTTIHGGLRYRFVGIAQRDAFLGSPAVYESYAATLGGQAGTRGSASDAGSGSRPAEAGSSGSRPAGQSPQPGSDSKPPAAQAP